MSTFGNDVLMQLKVERRPVTGTLLADLNGWSVRTTNWWLKALESAGVVCRPYGRKGGWVAV